jgi:hypothetical protein
MLTRKAGAPVEVIVELLRFRGSETGTSIVM